MTLESYHQFSVQEDDTHGKSHAAWAEVCGEMTREGEALRKLREEYERDPRPLRLVKTTYQVLVDVAPNADGGIDIEVDSDAKVSMDQAIEAIQIWAGFRVTAKGIPSE